MESLFRKVNTTARNLHHRFGLAYRHERNRKDPDTSMKRKVERGLDYTPLCRFLLSRVDQPWAPTLSEAQRRLHGANRDAIFWMVALNDDDKKPFVRVGENSYFSGLFVDADEILRKVDPGLGVEQMIPGCSCCTHTFNGVPFTKTSPWG